MVSLMKCIPWFETMVKGHPNLIKMHLYKNLAMITTILEHKAFSSMPTWLHDWSPQGCTYFLCASPLVWHVQWNLNPISWMGLMVMLSIVWPYLKMSNSLIFYIHHMIYECVMHLCGQWATNTLHPISLWW